MRVWVWVGVRVKVRVRVGASTLADICAPNGYDSITTSACLTVFPGVGAGLGFGDSVSVRVQVRVSVRVWVRVRVRVKVRVRVRASTSADICAPNGYDSITTSACLTVLPRSEGQEQVQVVQGEG